MILVEAINESYDRISSHIYHTPLSYSQKLSNISGADVYLKCEHLQKTGSFKLRGALNKILSLKERNQEVIAASTGNHGLGVALAAKIVQLPATIFVPKSTSKMKIDSIKALNAQIEYIDGGCLQAELKARQVAKEKQSVFISPYNDIDVIAGQGTIGVEIVKDNVEADAIFISVGGGGLISGIGSYLKHQFKETEIIGCWPEVACSLFQWLKAKKVIPVTEAETISDSTQGEPEADTITFELCKEIINKSYLVSEQQIANAMRLVAECERWIIEGSAGVALGAFLQNMECYKGKVVIILLCGRNIIFEKFLTVIR
jgi:threonine dehydratase